VLPTLGFRVRNYLLCSPSVLVTLWYLTLREKCKNYNMEQQRETCKDRVHWHRSWRGATGHVPHDWSTLVTRGKLQHVLHRLWYCKTQHNITERTTVRTITFNWTGEFSSSSVILWPTPITSSGTSKPKSNGSSHFKEDTGESSLPAWEVNLRVCSLLAQINWKRLALTGKESQNPASSQPGRAACKVSS